MWIKKFRKRIVQSLLIFAVVAMCTTLITGSAVILTSLTSLYEKLVEETNAPDVKVYSRPGFETMNYKEKLEKQDCVNKVIPINKVSVTMLKFNGTETDEFLDICEYKDEVYKNIRMISGSIDNLRDGYCLLPKATALSVGADVGDIVTILLNGEEYSYKIAGTYAEIYSAVTEYTCDMLINSLPENADAQQVFAVYLKDGTSCDDLISAYTSDNDGILDGYFRSSEDSVINAELAELILGGILLGISSVVFLAILLILGYIVKNCFTSDKKTVAVYKTIGYSKKQIKKIYITFYMSIISVGAITGGLMSPILSNAFKKGVYKNIGESGGTNGIIQMLICILAITGISFLMLLIETRRVTAYRPVDILNGNDEEKNVKKRRESKKSRYGFSPLAMAVRMMMRDKRNTILLIVTCIISLYIVNLSVVCIQNMDLIQSETNYYWLGIDKHDITIENIGDQEEFYQICDEIKEDSSVSDAVKRNYDMGFAIPYHQTTSALIFETYDDVNMPVVKGRNPQYSDEVVVGNIYLKELGIDVGDYLTVQLDATHRKDLLIVGSFQGFYNMGRGVKVLGSLLDENDVNYNYTQCSITLNKGVDKAEFMQHLKDTYKDKIKVIDRMNLYSSIMSVICDPQREALLPFAVITIMIGALNAFYIIYSSNVSKRKKFTIYKSLGYTTGHLIKMNCWYVGIIVLISIIAAVTAFIFLFPKIMLLAMSAFGFAEYKLVVKPITLVIINVSMLCVFIVAACLAGFEIRKNRISEIMNE